MAGTRRSTPSALTSPRSRRPNPCVTARNAHYAEAAVRRFRVLRITAVIAALVSAGFGFYQLTLGSALWPMGIVNIATAVAFLALPLLRGFGELVPPLAFTALAYASLFYITWHVGTGSGLLFYYPIAATIVVLTLGVERIALAGVLAAAAAQLLITWLTRSPVPTVGASGGLFALLLAFGMLFPNRIIMPVIPPIPMKARTFVILFGAIELFSGLGGPSGVAHFAHLGGMLGGWLMMMPPLASISFSMSAAVSPS